MRPSRQSESEVVSERRYSVNGARHRTILRIAGRTMRPDNLILRGAARTPLLRMGTCGWASRCRLVVRQRLTRSGAVGAGNFPIGVFIEWRRPYLAIEASAHAGAHPARLCGCADTRPRRTDSPESVLFNMFAVACAGLGWRACQRCREDGQCQKPDRRSCHTALQGTVRRAGAYM